MDDYIVSPDLDGNRVIWYHKITQVEIVIEGDETRSQLAKRLMDELESISGQAIHLLESFMKDHGTFELSSIEVLPVKSEDGSNFSLRYTFTADHDCHEYGYTYFDVYFSQHQPLGPLFWPHKFTIEFH